MASSVNTDIVAYSFDSLADSWRMVGGCHNTPYQPSQGFPASIGMVTAFCVAVLSLAAMLCNLLSELAQRLFSASVSLILTQLTETVAPKGHERDILLVSNGGTCTLGKAYALVTVRDINLICQHYKTYAHIESQTRRRKITRARRSNGILEVRTEARDEWMQPVVWIEWINDMGIPIRYMLQDIR